MIRTTAIAGVLAFGLAAPAASAPAEAGARLEGARPATAWAQYYGYGPRYYRRGPSGGEVAAGVIGGLAAGALIGGAIASQQPQAAPALAPDMVAYCARKYRSFDPASGTYLARDGQRYYCQ
jgi:hypothetical protein